MIQSGAVIGGYRVERLLGRGGMGVVYEATQLELDRRVALKLLSPDLGEDEAFVARFRREGEMQAALDHPHVVPVYEAGESEHGLYLAMKLIPGTTLAGLLATGGLDVGRAMGLLSGVADALDAAHAAGLVHRDITPQNVLVDEEDHAYLADFGLTKTGAHDLTTASGKLVGTFAYIAPEVAKGAAATPASDRYGYAAVLYECLCGERVFPRDGHAATLLAHTTDPVPPISSRRAGLPEALDPLFDQALAKDPGKRPASASSLTAEIAGRLDGVALDALPPVTPRPLRPATTVEDALPAKPVSGRRTAATLAATALVAAAVGAGGFAIADDDGAAAGVADPSDEPAPAIPRGTVALGSALEPGDDIASLNCRGKAGVKNGEACTVAQLDLPGQRLVAPANGAIRGFWLRGATGEFRLSILRERDRKYFQTASTPWLPVTHPSVHHLPANLRVERGDRIALAIAYGSSAGVRRNATGATTLRFFPPRKGTPEQPPTFRAGSGFDHEILLRVDFVAGAEPKVPAQIRGAAAAAAPKGKEIERHTLKFSNGRSVQIGIVELPGKIVVDLFRNGQRVARSDVPDIRPGGRPLGAYTYNYPEQDAEGEVGFDWASEDSGRLIFKVFGVGPRDFLYYD